jgi:hypothetical protein
LITVETDFVLYPKLVQDFSKFRCECQSRMGLSNFDDVERDANGFTLQFQVDGNSDECPMGGRSPRIGGKIQLAVIILRYGTYINSFS